MNEKLIQSLINRLKKDGWFAACDGEMFVAVYQTKLSDRYFTIPIYPISEKIGDVLTHYKSIFNTKE